MLLPVAITPRKNNPTAEAVALDYPGQLLEFQERTDKDGLLFSPVTFTGDRALQDAVTTVTALVLDYDDGTPPERAIEPWLPYDFVIYTSFSHLLVDAANGYDGRPRFRIVLPLARPLEGGAFRALWKWATTVSAGVFDPNCKDLFRRYYLPSHRPEASEHFAIHNSGRLLDLPAQLAFGLPPATVSAIATKTGLLGAIGARPEGGERAAGSIFAGIGAARAVRQAEDVEAIERRCAFMAHARDDAAILEDPEWYAALSIWVRCEDGDTLSHERSEPYDGYSEEETAAKIERAKEHGPATCARLSETFPGCKTCPHFGRITSPVQLGTPDATAAPAEAAERAAGDLEAAREALAVAKAALHTAREALKAKEKGARYLAEPSARAAETQAERRAVDAAAEERDRAFAFVKSAERKARQLEAAAVPPEGVAIDVWRALKLNPATQAPVGSYSNIYRIARLDPLLGPQLRTNMLGDIPEWGGKDLKDNDLSMITEYLSDDYGLEARLQDVKYAIAAVASRETYNPAAEWLRRLPPWDGTPRMAAILRDVLHTEDTPDGLYETYITKFMMAAVRRAFTPGNKVDTMLVLQGPQSVKKTSFFQKLFSEPFIHHTKFDVDNKDAYGQIAYGWAYEWGELSQLSRKDIEAVKNFITNQKDTYRSAYAHFARVHHRHTVFVGTTNNPTPLNDPTGSRRFWIIPIPNKKIDLMLLVDIRDQLWAEALARADTGAIHYLTDEEEELNKEDARQFEEEDPRRIQIQRWIEKRSEPFFMSDVCTILGIPCDRSGARAIGPHLRDLGCVSRPLDGGSVRKWMPPPRAEQVAIGGERSNVVVGNFPGTKTESAVSTERSGRR